MTSGSKTDDQRVNVTCGVIIQPQGWYVVGPSIRPIGSVYTKVWSGSDYPPTKPVYTRDTLITREGKVLSFKRRVDVPTRRKTVDHPYSATISFFRDTPVEWNRWSFGQIDEQAKYKSQDLWSYGWVQTNASDSWNSNDDLKAIDKLREKVAGSDFNMGVFLGEGREALAMIANSATRLFQAYRSVKKGRVGDAVAALTQSRPKKYLMGAAKPTVKKTAAQNWLELQYGWIPLVKDAFGAAEFLAKVLNFPMIQTYKVRRKKNIEIGPIAGTQFEEFFGHGVTQVQIIARLEEVDTAKLSGLTDPASVVWELTPFSFVADWFIPIGSYLAARSLASALTGTFVTTKTTRIACTYKGIKQTVPFNGYAGTQYTVPPRGSYFSIDVQRAVSSSLQVPTPKFKTLDKIASWKHCANAVALLVATHGSGPKSASRHI